MNIQPSAAAASIAGTSHAAARGGESDKLAIEARAQQVIAETPAGKSSETNALDAGDPSGDRGGDGRQVLDVFERSEQRSQQDSSDAESESQSPASQGHLDIQA